MTCPERLTLDGFYLFNDNRRALQLRDAYPSQQASITRLDQA